MIDQLTYFLALFLLMLVTGVFWGPWFALHRSLHVFNEDELIHLVKTLAANLGVPMRFLFPACLLFMGLSSWLYSEKNVLGFYLTLIALSLIVVSLFISVVVELPIVNQIKQWTAETIPSDWEAIRDRWVSYHVLRTCTALVSFACFLAAILLL